MNSIERDPVINAIYGGIKRGIQVAIENECFDSAVILILSGIDSMAFLSMPGNQQDVRRDDFVKWVDRYIKFPCDEQLTGLDLYGARCAMLHTFGVVSDLSRKGLCRMLAYMDHSVPEIIYNQSAAKDLVLVSVTALAEAFYRGLDQFLVDLFCDKEKAKIAEQRLSWFVQKRSRKNMEL
jgi:hypothetical protein